MCSHMTIQIWTYCEDLHTYGSHVCIPSVYLSVLI